MKTNKLLEFTFLEYILYYDGPLISLGLTQDNSPVLEIWCNEDREKNFNLYAYAFMKEEDLQPFIDAEKSFFNVLKDSLEIIVFKYDGKAFDFEVWNNEDFLKEYGPKEHSDLNKDLIDFREKFNVFMHTKKEVL